MQKAVLRHKYIRSSNVLIFGVVILLSLLVFGIIRRLSGEGADVANLNSHEAQVSGYDVVAPELPKEVSFAGELVPVENYDVYQALDYEILKVMFWHSETMLYLKRKPAVFEIVEPILKEYGVPDDFKYLMVTESGMVNVVSPAKAAGYWQFLKSTGREYGLEINGEVDERYDLRKSTQAACKYLQDSYKAFGNWTLAAASYNGGRGRMRSEIERQKQKSFYDLLLLRETSRYIYRIVAYKLILSNPKKYGLTVPKELTYKYPQTRTVKVSSPIPSLIDFAIKYKTNYKILKKLNPWLRSDKLTNPNLRTYYINVPVENGREIDD